MAALQLTEAGMSVLLLDAGFRPRFRDAPLRRTTAAFVKCVADPRLQFVLPPAAVNFGRKTLRAVGRIRQAVQTKCWAWELAPDAFVDDTENPYINEPGTNFDWFRVHGIGGRMTVPGHGRQYYRLSEHDLDPGDGLSPRWPVCYSELRSWYDFVEEKLGLSAGVEDCQWVPAGRPSTVIEPTVAEAQTIAVLKRRWPRAHVLLGRWAPPLRSVERAAATGRLVCRQGACVQDLQIGGDGRVSGVRWRDRAKGTEMGAKAPIVFVCASALETTRILLSSQTSAGKPIGSRSSALGTHLMDHVLVSAQGRGGALGAVDAHVQGRCIYLPRFDLNISQQNGSRGYSVQVHQWPIGTDRSHFTVVSFGEMTPRAENRVVLDFERKDAWGLPVLRIACRHSETELKRAKDQSAALREIGDTLGVRFYNLDATAAPAGTAVHECGTARMGDRPDVSVLDPNNQCWDAKGVYVTDASAFPSQGTQNPTLTILALTARACAHVIGGRRDTRSTGWEFIPHASDSDTERDPVH